MGLGATLFVAVIELQVRVAIVALAVLVSSKYEVVIMKFLDTTSVICRVGSKSSTLVVSSIGLRLLPPCTCTRTTPLPRSSNSNGLYSFSTCKRL